MPERELQPTLPDDLRAWLTSRARMEARPAGNVIFERGTMGDVMYLVESGRIEISFTGGLPPKSLGPGTFFGELALLMGNNLRTATVTVREDARLCTLDRSLFVSLKRDDPARFADLLEATCGYLVRSEQTLIGELERRNAQLRETLESLRRARIDLDSAELSALTDELTGLYNRRSLNRQIDRLCEGGPPSHPVTLLIADIDHFKQINDAHGHTVGDLVLGYFATALRNQLRWTDLPVRLGGDEFAVLLTDLAPDYARERAVRMFDAIGRFEVDLGDGEALSVSASMGGAMGRLTSETWEDFYARVDSYLYAAKQAGRARLHWEGTPVG